MPFAYQEEGMEMADYSSPESMPVKKGIPRWLIIGGVVLAICLVGGCVAVVLTLLSPSINATLLPNECMKQNPDMNSQACVAWASEVSTTKEYEQCFKQGMEGAGVGVNELYACLVEQGVGPCISPVGQC
jgi:hypothetical protein